MTANTSIPRAATTADSRARVFAIDHGLSFVTMDSSAVLLCRSGTLLLAECSLDIGTPGSGEILDPARIGRLASNDSSTATCLLLALPYADGTNCPERISAFT